MADESNKSGPHNLLRSFAEALLHASKKSNEGSLSDKVFNDPQIRRSTSINTEGKNLTPASHFFDPYYHPQYIIPTLSISPGKIAEAVRDAVKDSLREEFAKIVDEKMCSTACCNWPASYRQ